ncbi:MAG TPA: DUF6600 domain-containing protein, partial [Vicinamibacterales bacterium]|nr:DUF6600 domain-containing protein [Vicinamibacterales bacterium]
MSLALAPAAAAEDPPAPAHIAVVDGAATLERDGRIEPAAINVPLLAGDRLRTRDGRVEVIYGDGSVLDLDHYTTVDFLDDTLVRVLEGAVRLTFAGRDAVRFRLDLPAASVRIETPGEYRISLLGRDPEVELVVLRGEATLVNDLGETIARAGERALARAASAPSPPEPYNSARWDAFEAWAAERRAARTGEVSSRYLPPDVRTYGGALDRHGSWHHHATYGFVWYPRVHAGWRPYYYGRWDYAPWWGWTWISFEPWGWTVFHYGRWGFEAGRWFWIPGPRWGPAWVYWATAPGFIGWCPLGWDNRPIVNLIVNVFPRRSFVRWHAWTFVPRHVFVGRVSVARHVV